MEHEKRSGRTYSGQNITSKREEKEDLTEEKREAGEVSEDDFDMTSAIMPAPVGAVTKVDHHDHGYDEETAAEFAAPAGTVRSHDRINHDRDHSEEPAREGANRSTGYIALALSIIGLFILPVILGAAGIIVGFVARRKDAKTMGNWAIGIGIVAVLMGLFITPFY
ncbi:DUF4190 domain-containing protein [Metabacillus sp. RGM 3146]|uniref:DUF4190 domain-containing protein n=1 Tax=Metabacillus sp. RGM 3146 TaxID=3401092 RepID=UPI003B99E0F1